MARTARIKSTSGTYHVLLKAKDERLFCDDEDAQTFLDLLLAEKILDYAEIYAFCMFEFHVHIVIKEGLSGISKNIMRLCSLYGKYYNAKYGLEGKLFGGRFKSEPLNEMHDILECTRYVHRLPLKAGEDMEYFYSSFASYFKKSELISSEEIIMMVGSQIDYKIYCDEESEDETNNFLSIQGKRKATTK